MKDNRVVRIPWTRQSENEAYWNEVCAWAIEYFGLPGERFITKANVLYMDFVFEDQRDALIMSLRWNGSIVSEDQETVEFVGRLING